MLLSQVSSSLPYATSKIIDIPYYSPEMLVVIRRASNPREDSREICGTRSLVHRLWWHMAQVDKTLRNPNESQPKDCR